MFYNGGRKYITIEAAAIDVRVQGRKAIDIDRILSRRELS
jgi:hypothetical protein